MSIIITNETIKQLFHIAQSIAKENIMSDRESAEKINYGGGAYEGIWPSA